MTTLISRHLNLTGASIVNISTDAFRGLGGLGDSLHGLLGLSLASNALDKFPATALRPLNSLQRLFIGGNFIERLATNDLKGMPDLRTLDLSQSPNLVHIEANVLADNYYMEMVDVSGCPQLTAIEDGAFTLGSFNEVMMPNELLKFCQMLFDEIKQK